MKTLFIASISILLTTVATHSSAMNHAFVNLQHISPEQSEAIWIRALQVPPRYPIELARKGIAGCGVFKVTVDQDGKTQQVQLINSVPENVIFKPAKKVIKQWQWQNVSGQPNAVEQKQIRLDFCLGGKTESQAKARCAAQAKLVCGA